jgi:hypothetical protein
MVGGEGGGEPGAPGTHYIQVTQEEREAIDRVSHSLLPELIRGN